QAQRFELRHRVGEELRGSVTARSGDGPRREWWEKCGWQSGTFSLATHVHVRDEKWVIGSPTILFPPGVKRQFVRVWNDAEQERLFETEAPSGYHLLTSFGVAVDQRS